MYNIIWVTLVLKLNYTHVLKLPVSFPIYNGDTSGPTMDGLHVRVDPNQTNME